VYRGASNGDLINGAKPLDVDLDELERAGGYISADQCLSYEDHRGNVLLPLAAAAVQQPDLADRLNALMHVISSQPGAFKGGYPRVENDLEWDKAIDRTERLMAQGAPVRGLGSFYHAAELGGFMRVPAPEPLELVTPPRVMEIAPAGVGGIECSRLSNLMSSGVAYKRPIELGGWLVLGELTVLNAPGGVGKTTLEVLMALALATGSSHLLDLMVYSARPVLFLNYEEVTQELVLKFRAAARHHRVEVDDLARIHLYGSDTVPATTMTVVDLETRQARVNAVWFAWLRQLVIETGAQVIFLDPYSALMPHGMNDNGLTYSVVRALKSIASECGCAIVVSAHTKKFGTLDGDGAEAVMGAAALINGARVVLGIRKLDAVTAKAIGAGYGEEDDYREIVNQKANYTPVGRGKYVRMVGVPMNNAGGLYKDGDWVAVAEPYSPRVGGRSLPLAAIKDAAIQLARGSSGGGEPYCQKKGGDRWFGADIAAAIKPHLPDLGPKALEAAAKELVAEGLNGGWIVIRPYKNIHRKNSPGLMVVWAATDFAHDPAPSGVYQA
jgi:hypothetical protein